MRVLVVEDDQAMASSLTWGLESEGYVVDVAGNGEDGLWKAREWAHDVIVLDVMLPGLDGYQVCQRLRDQGVWTPILMLTAMDEDLDHAEGLDSGADDYLTKPFSYPVLLAHLRSLTRRGLPERPAVLSAAGLTVDPASRTVLRARGTGRANHARGCGTGVPYAPPGTRGLQDGAAGPLLGHRIRRRTRRRRGADSPAPPQDRSFVRSAGHRHHPGRGLPDPAGRPVTATAPPGGREARLWPRLRTLRARVTIVASVVITAVVLLGFLLLYDLQADAARRTIDGQLRTYITQIEQAGQHGHWPRPLPPSTLDASADAQVIGANGHVLAATRTLTGLPAVYLLPAGTTQPVRQTSAAGVVPNEVRVVAIRTTVSGRPVVIIAEASTGLLSQLNSEFAARLLLAIPVALVLAGVTVWLIVGRALRPVEHIRRAVTEITSADLSRRVPEPGTADEIGHLANTMNDMLGRLDAAARRQRRFVADASHELRTPLAAIRTTLDVGLAYPDKAPWPVIAERASAAIGTARRAHRAAPAAGQGRRAAAIAAA